MNDLECFDTEQLEAELEKRKQKKEEKVKPKPISNPDWIHVETLCQEYVDMLFRGGKDYGDFDDYIFEAAIEAVFGKDVWSWIGART